MRELLTRRQIAELLNVHPKTIDNLRRQPDFPEPLRLGPQTLRWRADHVEAWVGSRSSAPAPRRRTGRRSTAAELMS